MKYAKTDYPVGATWKGVDETGKIAYIWLERRAGKHEAWYWSCSYSDGSRPLHWSDWNTSYRLCKDELPINCRMRRIK